MKLVTLPLVAIMAAATLYAAPMSQNTASSQRSPVDTSLITEEQQMQLDELLQRKIDIESQSHLARIVILEDAEVCIQLAETLEMYRECERSENQARADLREELKDDKELLRDDFRALIKEIRESQA